MRFRYTLHARLMLAAITFSPAIYAQAPAAQAGKAGAPWDITGYWVSMVTDDWRYRMLTPPKGNVDYLPITAEGRRQTQQWDPAKDEAAGEACKAYGAGGILRLPGRLHVTWENDNTLKMDIDTGQQTRRFFFPAAQAAAASTETLQGHSAAQWDFPGIGRGFPGAQGRGANPSPAGPPHRFGQLRVVTTSLKPGYVRKNGVPYSSGTVITEYFVHLTAKDAQEYLAVTVMVDDPRIFQPAYIKTYQFKKQRDNAGWNPTACAVK